MQEVYQVVSKKEEKSVASLLVAVQNGDVEATDVVSKELGPPKNEAFFESGLQLLMMEYHCFCVGDH
jgi:hypothetical protein